MAKNEEGEFELVLGNKQLLSVFFIVVILLGVFFTMGYVVGRNSAPVVETASTASATSETSGAAGSAKPPPMVVDPAKTAAPPAGDSVPAPTTATPPPGVAATPPPSTPKQAETAAAAQGGVVTPQPGEMYIQVLALAKPEAEVLVDVLGKKGFNAVVAPGPNDRVFRVLVGPAKDTMELNKLRNDVEAAGFKGAFAKKY